MLKFLCVKGCLALSVFCVKVLYLRGFCVKGFCIKDPPPVRTLCVKCFLLKWRSLDCPKNALSPEVPSRSESPNRTVLLESR